MLYNYICQQGKRQTAPDELTVDVEFEKLGEVCYYS